jgi:hypothetical protein
MPFIQTCLAQSESASPKATTLYVHNMLLFLVACLLNRWQRASSARCVQNKARGLTTPRSSKPPFPDIPDVICTEIQVSQRCALRQHSCKTLCTGIADLIAADPALRILLLSAPALRILLLLIQLSQRWALRHKKSQKKF